MVLLVITLSLVVLLTFVIVAFFAATTVNRTVENASSSAVSARMLADGAVGAIEGELIQEIIVGSAPPVTAGNRTIYFSANATGMVPQRAVYVEQDFGKADYPNFVNVVKQSGQPFFNNAIVFKFTSGAATDTPSGNGRKINPASWSAPMLTGGNFSSSTAPKWIYVNTNGYSATANASTSSNPTIGRIAFNVYDIGGLIDINASGHGISITPEVVTSKGTPAATDLTALPGIKPSADRSNLSHSWPPTWRLRGRWEKFQAGSMPFYSRTGWLEPLPRLPPPDTNDADRMFNSRQDLIRYAKAYPETFDQTGTLIPALQYLTTFSRDLDQPTHRPDPARPKVQQAIGAGGNDAHGFDDALNPALPLVLKMDGTPAIQRRFPLTRLELVATPDPGSAWSGDAAKVREYFGLEWDAPNNRWVYNHGDASDILPLSDIPAGREPDFFELLKAAISVGSLGKQLGFHFPRDYAGTPAIRNLMPFHTGGADGAINYQIIQIAANIIDQSDADSYPTRILFDGREFYGTEDLPRIVRARDRSFNLGAMAPTFRRPGAAASPDLYVVMVQPELWNPHAPSPNPPSSGPAKFRVVARSVTAVGGEVTAMWNAAGTGAIASWFSNFSPYGGPNCSSLINYTANNNGITFNLGSGEAEFREPRVLARVGYPAGSNSNGFPNSPDMAPTAMFAPGAPDTIVRVQIGNPAHLTNGFNPVPTVNQPMSFGSPGTADALGFVTSYLPFHGAGPAINQYLQIWRGRGGPLQLDLQYEGAGGWWTIDRMHVSYNGGDQRFHHIQVFIPNRFDPRSERWGPHYTLPAMNDPMVYNHIYDFGITGNPGPNVFSPAVPYGDIYPARPGWTGYSPGFQMGRVQRNTAADSFRYTDPDGVLRRATAAFASDGDSAGWPMHSNNFTSRPVILNRPFRSVAELGHAFRGTPWKNLDFMTKESGDRALLDVFSVDEGPEDTLVAGRVNLNTRQIPVLSSLIQGAGLVNGSVIDKTTATGIAQRLAIFTRGTTSGEGPLRDRSELVGRYVPQTSSFAGPAESMAQALTANDSPIERNRDVIIASLADVGTVRTWNVLIDVIAQSGSVTAGGNFIVNGEGRIWHSSAIDRLTTTVLDRHSESVSE
jgi:hypothetical protein